MKKVKRRSTRLRSPRPNLRALDSLDEAMDTCDNIAALAQLLGHDPSEAVNRIGTLLYREASDLHDLLIAWNRHSQPKRN